MSAGLELYIAHSVVICHHLCRFQKDNDLQKLGSIKDTPGFNKGFAKTKRVRDSNVERSGRHRRRLDEEWRTEDECSSDDDVGYGSNDEDNDDGGDGDRGSRGDGDGDDYDDCQETRLALYKEIVEIVTTEPEFDKAEDGLSRIRSNTDSDEFNEVLEEVLQHIGLGMLLASMSTGVSKLFALVGIEATPWRAIHGVSGYIGTQLAVDVRVIEPAGNPQYIGFCVEGSPQQGNPFHVQFKALAPPVAHRRPTEHELRLDWLLRKGFARRDDQGSVVDVTGPFKVVLKAEDGVTGLKVEKGAQLTKSHSLKTDMVRAQSPFMKCLKKKEPLTEELRSGLPCEPEASTLEPVRHIEIRFRTVPYALDVSLHVLPVVVLECFDKPANYEQKYQSSHGDHLTWEEFVEAVKNPTVGMDAYVFNMTKIFQQEPQQTVCFFMWCPTSGVP